MVIWIIGLSASGKTTLAEQVTARLRNTGRVVVLLDGDVIRQLFRNDVDHTVEGRHENAQRLSQLTAFLATQGVDVVAAVLSIFPDWQSWNRSHIPGYKEVYLKASMDTLLRRETKNLYSRALRGEIINVVGVDIPFPEPLNADLILENDIDRREFEDMVDEILRIAT